jgi:putative endonuclease
MSNYIIYLLYNTNNNSTYVGITVNKERRIRQHNGELVGGAKYTKLKKQDGEWIYYGKINNLEKCQALSIEKKIQKRTRKSIGLSPIDKRLNCINKLLEDYDNIEFDADLII